MRRIRIYHPESVISGKTTILQEDASRHLLQVLRKKEGDTILIFNGDGHEYQATIVGVEKKKAIIEIGTGIFSVVESPVRVHLGQGLSRGDRMDYAIQKAVELGVTEITPLVTEFSQVKLSEERSEKRLLHWRQIAVSAAEQSGRCVVPVIHSPILLKEWLQQDKSELKVICCPRQSEENELPHAQPIKTISVAIGPEGGFSDDEIMRAVQAKFYPLQLGPRVLRTETAAVVALTLLQHSFGDV